MADPLVVVKVGGSLYDLPDLGPRLRRWLAAVPRALLIPGGGPTADVVRDLDRRHQLGEAAAHWLAIRALSLNAHFLARLLPDFSVVPDPIRAAPGSILEPYPFFQQDEASAEPLPHRWSVTSDSLAVRVAAVAGAAELVLLKSVAWDGPWDESARAGVVDAYFPEALRQVGRPLSVRVVNLRGG